MFILRENNEHKALSTMSLQNKTWCSRVNNDKDNVNI